MSAVTCPSCAGFGRVPGWHGHARCASCAGLGVVPGGSAMLERPASRTLRTRAHKVQPGDELILSNGKGHRIVGTSRAIPARSDEIALIGERRDMERSPVWRYGLNDRVIVRRPY